MRLHIPIDLYTPRQSANVGNCFWAVNQLTAYDDGHWEFVKDVDGYLYGRVRVPDNISASPMTQIELNIKAGQLGAGRNAVFTVAAAAIADGESMNPAAFSTPISYTILMPSTINVRTVQLYNLYSYVTVEAGDLLLLEICHKGTDLADTLQYNSHLDEAYLRVDVL